jgi:regulator of protease activity HflC (stomatin/prohibitin superfamily)
MGQVIFGILLVVLGALAFLICGRLSSRFAEKQEETNKKLRERGREESADANPFGMMRWGGAGLALIGGLLLFTSGIVICDPGYNGVVVLFGETQPVALNDGPHLVNPLCSVVKMNYQAQKDEEAQTAETSDTQSVTIKIITTWCPIRSSLPVLYREYGLDYPTKLLGPAAKECLKAEIARHKVTELIAKRPEIHHNVQQTMNERLNQYGIKVIELAIADIDFSDKYDAAIEAKQVQEQQALQKEYELKKTQTEAQMAAAKAKGEADSKIAEATGAAESVRLAAQAEADALKIRAEAQAAYNQKVSQSLSPLLLQSTYLQRWDGKLPVYTLGAGGNTMLMLPAATENK